MNHQSRDSAILTAAVRELTNVLLLQLIFQHYPNLNNQPYICSQCRRGETLSSHARTVPEPASGSRQPVEATAATAATQPRRNPFIPATLPDDLVDEFNSFPPHLQLFIILKERAVESGRSQAAGTSNIPDLLFQQGPLVREAGDDQNTVSPSHENYLNTSNNAENAGRLAGAAQNRDSRSSSFWRVFSRRRRTPR